MRRGCGRSDAAMSGTGTRERGASQDGSAIANESSNVVTSVICTGGGASVATSWRSAPIVQHGGGTAARWQHGIEQSEYATHTGARIAPAITSSIAVLMNRLIVTHSNVGQRAIPSRNVTHTNL